MEPATIYAIERPHRSLLTLYILRSVLTGPLVLITLPLLYFRYITMRYRFDEEGVSMRWGILFRREVNLTYARIQDIHLSSGVLQRWLGLADVQIQTASGSASAEMTIEGLREYGLVRDYLYSRMRGQRGAGASEDRPARAAATDDGDVVELLSSLADELRQTRRALERLAEQRAAGAPARPARRGEEATDV
jgi:putative membrane protein